MTAAKQSYHLLAILVKTFEIDPKVLKLQTTKYLHFYQHRNGDRKGSESAEERSRRRRLRGDEGGVIVH